jgi:hypothetical protein
MSRIPSPLRSPTATDTGKTPGGLMPTLYVAGVASWLVNDVTDLVCPA